ncbi:hypothetical protein XENTR_v10000223 [Xenopus tropicalis]|uniref:Uncharacterized protein LOC101734896 isoform X1 n=1 Tax=Xenopus tropicalis TaxID=8364 RepID=A0A8J0S6P8_XENTR|nr:uncharacterized protein LOC101734896 isoform X1 [Xenopus tropicalis]KAE8628790.1 hypothetical protein XENTR_v10000223 [Xenopus tropicalis]|eukprot:XP_012811210.1 PREDICTED: uncharacterized protein LOC101734896 [Xenopus tropicalis]
MEPIYLIPLLLLFTVGRGERVQEILADEGGSVPLGGRPDFDRESMMADLYNGDQWLASYHDGLDPADQYKGRIFFRTGNGSFLLRDLTGGDSSNYTYSVHQAINGNRNKSQICIHLIVREQNPVTVKPRGPSLGHGEPNILPSYSVRDVMWLLSVCLSCLSLVHPFLCLSCALWRCCQGGKARFLLGNSFSSIATTETALDIPPSSESSPSTNQGTAGGGAPLCRTLYMKISSWVSLACVCLSLLFYFLYDNGNLRANVWVLLGVAAILIGINIAPLFKCCGIPCGWEVSPFPYGNLCHSSREGSCIVRLLGYLSVALVGVFTLCLCFAG